MPRFTVKSRSLGNIRKNGSHQICIEFGSLFALFAAPLEDDSFRQSAGFGVKDFAGVGITLDCLTGVLLPFIVFGVILYRLGQSPKEEANDHMAAG